MKFSDLEVVETSKTEVAPEVTAVECAEEISRLKLRIEELEAKRDEAIEKAYKNGVAIFGGYKFSEVKASGTLSEKKLIELHPDINDGYVEYTKAHAKVKLTKSGLLEYLKEQGHTNPDLVVAEITVAGKGVSYRMTAQKEKEVAE